MSDEEIVPRPPSHPIATGLLIASTFGVMANIGLVLNELNTYYLPKDPGKARYSGDKVWNPISVIESYGNNAKRIEYYKEDFKGKVEDDIKPSGGGADGN